MGERDKERNINVRVTHQLAASCTRPNKGQESKPQAFGPWANALATEQHWRGLTNL